MSAEPLLERIGDPLADARTPVDTIRASYDHCALLTKRSGSSFSAAFWMLPRAKRRALYAIYAFCRLTDDIADSNEVRSDRGRLLALWRAQLDAAYDGGATHPVAVALGDAVRRFDLPREYFDDLLLGIEADLRGDEIDTFEDLRRYCYRVASTVGLLTVRLLGVSDPSALRFADNAGIAVQLTNVIRDVGHDARVGRIYIAKEDLERLDVDPASLTSPAVAPSLRLLLALYAERARIFFEAADSHLAACDRQTLLPAVAMSRIYRELLDEMYRRGFPCAGEGLRLSRSRRMAIAVGTWLNRGAVG